jgi:acyl-CoA synthetase (AMP-forming)/AMP-acid ligase II
MLGSAPVYPRFLEELYLMCKPHVKILCLYGMTENLVVCAADGKEKMASQHKGDFLGKPLSGVELSFADDQEILLASPQLFSRYLHANNRETPHQTGDLGYLSENGELILTGRKKDMIIRRDTNIYPAIYEKTIRSIPGVHEAVMVGKYREDLHDEEVVLFVESDFTDEKKLLAQLTTGIFSIDKEALPDKIVFTKIPRSGRQDKVDRNALRKLLS